MAKLPMAMFPKQYPRPRATILDSKDQEAWTPEEWRQYALRLERRTRDQQLELDELKRRLSRKKTPPPERKWAPKGQLHTLLSLPPLPLTTAEQAAQILKVREELKSRFPQKRITDAMAIREWFSRRGGNVPLYRISIDYGSLLVAVSRQRSKNYNPPKVTSRKC